ncbi:MAG: hypothetical protein GTN80_11835 [Nitrososphaeria archaeon]|nr:hypothetical protein [Nitrososphaeria archaeon]NIQ34307.1 hypothetical protein [Nitrososphaeria archaeon]
MGQIKHIQKMNILIFDEKCTGCRACELACSFHFSKAFNRKISAIEVKRYDSEGRFDILIHKEPTGNRHACNLCSGEAEPLCVKYCTIEALLLGGESP